jgi:hypothetical protein
MPYPYTHFSQEDLDKALSPDQQQFISLLSDLSFDEAAEEMKLSQETIRTWMNDDSFRVFIREMEDIAIDSIVADAIREARSLLQEMHTLQEHMTLSQRAQLLKDIVEVLSSVKTYRTTVDSPSCTRDRLDAIRWRESQDDEDDEDEYEDEYEEETSHSQRTDSYPQRFSANSFTGSDDHDQRYRPAEQYQHEDPDEEECDGEQTEQSDDPHQDNHPSAILHREINRHRNLKLPEESLQEDTLIAAVGPPPPMPKSRFLRSLREDHPPQLLSLRYRDYFAP